MHKLLGQPFMLRTENVQENGMELHPPNLESAQAFIDRYQAFWNRLFNWLQKETPDA